VCDRRRDAEDQTGETTGHERLARGHLGYAHPEGHQIFDESFHDGTVRRRCDNQAGGPVDRSPEPPRPRSAFSPHEPRKYPPGVTAAHLRRRSLDVAPIVCAAFFLEPPVRPERSTSDPLRPLRCPLSLASRMAFDTPVGVLGKAGRDQRYVEGAPWGASNGTSPWGVW
jgi:hypothetical protein